MDNTCVFSNILNLINTLQKNSLCNESIDNTCSKPFLGNGLTQECSNTRPVTFYGCDNLEIINIAPSGLIKIGSEAFKYCSKIK